MQGLRVLIAEDEALISLTLKTMLEKLGCQVVGEAGDGQEAVTLAGATKPDLVLMDIRMPGMDGLEAARLIGEKLGIPVVFLTAYSDQEYIERAKAASVMAYLVKPVKESDLAPAIELALAQHQKMKAMEQQIETLQQALENRKFVERAKGILMDRLHITEEEAMRRLQKEARDQNRKLVEVAKAIILASKIF